MYSLISVTSIRYEKDPCRPLIISIRYENVCIYHTDLLFLRNTISNLYMAQYLE